MTTAPLFVTVGDPDGIGPEVLCRALANRRVPAVLVGQVDAIRSAAALAGLGDEWTQVVAPPQGDEPVEIRSIRHAVAQVTAGLGSALVTGPIHKAKLAARGFRYPGHTEFLGALTGVDRPVMAFVGGRLRVALVTTHIPLSAVPEAITPEGVLHTVVTAANALEVQLGLQQPRVVVCGVNPHAGDGGLLGHEDEERVRPGVQRARESGIDAVGPMSAGAAFLAARRGEADLVVAMYHDQGLAPLKAVDFGRCVNWTLGLPLIRTSVDHGTAYDLVGTGRADWSSAAAAIDLAGMLAAVTPG